MEDEENDIKSSMYQKHYSIQLCNTHLCARTERICIEADGAELFIPGISALFVAAVLVLVFAVSRVVKYIRLLKQL